MTESDGIARRPAKRRGQRAPRCPLPMVHLLVAAFRFGFVLSFGAAMHSTMVVKAKAPGMVVLQEIERRKKEYAVTLPIQFRQLLQRV